MAGHSARNLSVRRTVSQSGRATCENLQRGSPTAMTSAMPVTARLPPQRSKGMRGRHDTHRRFEVPAANGSPTLLHRSVSSRPTSALDQERTSPAYLAMSALPPKADKQRTSRYVRFVPIAAVSSCSKMSAEASLLDHLVGAREQGRWQRNPQRLGGPQIDGQCKLGRLHHRQIDGLGPFEDSPAIDRGLRLGFPNIDAVADEAAGLDELAQFVDRGNPVAGSQRDELTAPCDEDPVGQEHEPAGTFLHDARPGRVDLV